MIISQLFEDIFSLSSPITANSTILIYNFHSNDLFFSTAAFLSLVSCISLDENMTFSLPSCSGYYGLKDLFFISIQNIS